MEAADGNLFGKVAELEVKTEADRLAYEQVRAVRMEHDKEITEMVAQLDLVEAEHIERYVENEKMIKEKDAVISVLGSQGPSALDRTCGAALSQVVWSKQSKLSPALNPSWKANPQKSST